MDKLCTGNVKEYIMSISSVIADSTDHMAEQCHSVIKRIDVSGYRSIMVVGSGMFYAVGLSTANFMRKSTGMNVAVCSEEEARTYATDRVEEISNVIMLSICTTGVSGSFFTVMDTYQNLGALVIAITDMNSISVIHHCNCLLNIVAPHHQRNYPVWGYVNAVLALIFAGYELGRKKGLTEKYGRKGLSDTIHDAAFVLVQSQNRIDTAILSFIQNVSEKDYIQFVGYSSDFAQAYFGYQCFTEYSKKEARLVDTRKWLEYYSEIPTVVFSSQCFAVHEMVKAWVKENGTVLHCIVTDDITMQSTEKTIVVHLPHISEITLPLFSTVVPFLLLGHYNNHA